MARGAVAVRRTWRHPRRRDRSVIRIAATAASRLRAGVGRSFFSWVPSDTVFTDGAARRQGPSMKQLVCDDTSPRIEGDRLESMIDGPPADQTVRNAALGCGVARLRGLPDVR